MKLLFDQNLSPRLIEALSSTYAGSSHVQSLGLERATDDEIWHYAKENDFIIVTKDADFHERGILSGYPPKVVWIRRGNCTTSEILVMLEKHADDVRALSDDTDASVLVVL